jgi:glycerol-3-phosphate dehydrogenase
VLHLEARDLASGTSSRTSKLVHGGIRYLETGQFGLVKEALRERAILLDLAPEFVRPLPFLIPHYRGAGRPAGRVALGLLLYRALAGGRGSKLGRARRLTRSETLAITPGLNPEGLLGASEFWDAKMDDALLCVAIAMDAARSGGELRTHTALTSLAREGGSWRLRAKDEIDGAEHEAEARWVVNAAGPWADEVRGLAFGAVPPSMRRTRGTHVVIPASFGEHALLLTAGRDGRVFFDIPWGAHSLVGTTDVDDSSAPGKAGPPAEDIRYLLEEAARALPAMGRGLRPVRAFTGLRSLTRGRSGAPWMKSREHRLIEEPGMTTLIGGKYTTHRSLAERVVDSIVSRLEVHAAPSRTATVPIGFDRGERILAGSTSHRGRLDLPGGLVLTEAEAAHAVLEERARTLEDLLYRRTRLWLDARALRAAAGTAARWMAPHLHWSEERIASEVGRVRRALDDEGARIEEAMR